MTDESAGILPRRRRGRPRKPILTAGETVSSPVSRTPDGGPHEKAPKSAAEKYKMKNAADWSGEFEADFGGEVDMLRISKEEFPDGMDMKWVTETVYGQPFPQRLADAERAGWRTVDASDFDGRFRGRWNTGANGTITKDGLVLVARPMEISNVARKKQERMAREQVSIKERALLGGDLPGVSLDSRHKSAIGQNKINRSIERIDIPKD